MKHRLHEIYLAVIIPIELEFIYYRAKYLPIQLPFYGPTSSCRLVGSAPRGRALSRTMHYFGSSAHLSVKRPTLLIWHWSSKQHMDEQA